MLKNSSTMNLLKIHKYFLPANAFLKNVFDSYSRATNG